MKDRDGLHYIHKLLQNAGENIRAEDLYWSHKKKPNNKAIIEYSKLTDEQLEALGLSRGSSNDKIFILDDRAILDIKSRQKQVARRIEEVTDVEQKIELEDHLKILQDFLKKNTTPSGKSREATTSREKIRLAVTNAISRAITEISHNHESLGRHLLNSIYKGNDPVYNPDQAIPWQL